MEKWHAALSFHTLIPSLTQTPPVSASQDLLDLSFPDPLLQRPSSPFSSTSRLLELLTFILPTPGELRRINVHITRPTMVPRLFLGVESCPTVRPRCCRRCCAAAFSTTIISLDSVVRLPLSVLLSFPLIATLDNTLDSILNDD